MEDTFSNLATYGYIGLFLYSLGGGFVALVGAAVFSFMGKMDLTLSIFIAFLANGLGDTLLFYMARYQKSMMMEGLRTCPLTHSYEKVWIMDHPLSKVCLWDQNTYTYSDRFNKV